MKKRDAPVPPRGTAAFVGRTGELLQVVRLLRAAGRDGNGHLVVIRGPAGIGKTRLAEEVMARARERGTRVAMGRCWHQGEAPPLWPWRAILRDLGAPETMLEETPGEPRDRFARFVAVLDHLRSAARGGPSVIVVDDAHQADAASLLLLRFLARERRGLPVLLLVTRRDETEGDGEVRELLADLDREAANIRLTGLSEDAVRAYLAALGAPRPQPELLRAVAVVTKGNPLHLRSVASPSGVDAGGVEGGLERAIGGLLALLPAADRQVLAQAAVLGTEASVHEIARVAGAAPAAVAGSLARAAEVGLATLAGDGFRFLHDLVRQTALSSLSVEGRLDAHARAAALLTGEGPEQMSRRAHHALAAATRSREDAALAVAIARDAARTLKGVDGFESAASLLARADEIHTAAALATPAAALAVERADAVLACGRLAQARALYQRAARAAEAEDDRVAFARAALGLGGVWLGEHRVADEAERVLALQRRALDGLPATENVLRARLMLRLAAEDAYRGGPLASVLDALDAVRRTGDAHALAEALSLCHHALVGPEHTARRLALATELITAAADARDGLLALIGLCWRTADLFLLGDARAGAALEELRLRADTVHCRSLLFAARAMEVMLAIRGGSFEEAERAAAACFELGTDVGDADALAYQAGHLMAIRVFQGREAELCDLARTIAGSPTLVEERERAFALAEALFRLRAGDDQPGRRLLEQLARDGLGSVPVSSSWMTAMLIVAEIACALGDERAARAAYDALLPYADYPLMASLLAVVCFGSVHRTLGVAALTCGEVERAIVHFEAAAAANERLRHRPAAVQARAELALALLRRGAPGDAARGRSLLDRATGEAQEMGMTALAARWQRSADATGPARVRGDAQPARMDPVPAGRWRLVHDGQVATVPDRVGMRYLARLLAEPGRAISALALVVDDAVSPLPPSAAAEAVMDRTAVKALRERIGQLRQRPALSSSEEDEMEALTRELGRAMGITGRIRSFADAPERARTAVRKAIKRAIDEVSAANPAVGQHLAERVETGAACCYRPRSDPR